MGVKNKNKTKKIVPYPITTVCPYCGNPVVKTSNSEIYNGVEYGNGVCYLCRSCKAYVGVHYDLITPLGVLATGEMRELKKACHSKFDVIWKTKKLSRDDAYGMLASMMGISKDVCHIGWFGIDELNIAKQKIDDMFEKYIINNNCGSSVSEFF